MSFELELRPFLCGTKRPASHNVIWVDKSASESLASSGGLHACAISLKSEFHDLFRPLADLCTNAKQKTKPVSNPHITQSLHNSA